MRCGGVLLCACEYKTLDFTLLSRYRGMAGVPAEALFSMIIRTGTFFPQRENEDLSATISESSDLVNKNKVIDRAGEVC